MKQRSELRRDPEKLAAFQQRGRESGLKRSRPSGAGYDYDAFCQAIVGMDGETCWLRALLVARQARHPFDYSPGLLLCDGKLDGHHLLKKNRLKQEFRGGPAPLSDDVLAEVLSDPRNGVLVCRKHHDHLERGTVVLRREELPKRTISFAREHGLEGWLDRYYAPQRRAA